MRQVAAVIAAVVATPMVIAGSFALLSVWQLVTLDNWSPWLAISGFMLVSLLAIPAALVMTVAVAIPLVRWQQRRGQAGFPAIVRLGVLLGATPFLLFDAYIILYEFSANAAQAPGRLIDDLPVALRWATLAGLCGAGSASAYWAVLNSTPKHPERMSP